MDEKERFKAQYGNVSYDSPEFQKIKRKFDQEMGRKQEKEKNLQNAKDIKKLSKERMTNAEKALKLVDKVARQTQEKLQYHISNLVSMAEASVFDDPYQFEVEFVQRANKTECDLWFVKNKERLDPITPGEILREDFLKPLGITQAEFARRVGIPTNRVNEIAQGKRNISADTAFILAEALGPDATWWMDLQRAYDLSVEKQRRKRQKIRPIARFPEMKQFG